MSQADASQPYWDPFDFRIDDDPFSAWTVLRERASVYYNESFGFYALSRYDDVQAAFGDPVTFSNRHGTVYELLKGPDDVVETMRNMLFEDPAVHTPQRALMARAFTRRRVADLEPVVAELCTQYFEAVAGREEFDVVEDLGAKIPMMVIGALLGVPNEDREDIRDCANQGTALAAEDDTDFRVDPYVRLSDYFAELVAQRRKKPRVDIVSELAHAEMPSDGGPIRLTEHELLMYLVLLAAAGNETVARTVGWAAKVLGEHLDARARIAATPEMIPNAIEELMRFEPRSPVQGRRTLKGTVLQRRRDPGGVNGLADQRFGQPGRGRFRRPRSV